MLSTLSPHPPGLSFVQKGKRADLAVVFSSNYQEPIRDLGVKRYSQSLTLLSDMKQGNVLNSPTTSMTPFTTWTGRRVYSHLLVMHRALWPKKTLSQNKRF
jgi:hypothetical protein